MDAVDDAFNYWAITSRRLTCFQRNGVKFDQNIDNSKGQLNLKTY
jgi:hypothetical protein